MTNQALAKLLGCHVRSLERYRVRGLTPPRDGETPQAWVARAAKWRETNRGTPGRKGAKTADQKEADRRFRIAKAELAEMDLAQRRDALHSQEECRSLAAKRLADLRAAFATLPARLARRVYQAPSPEFIEAIAESEVRRCLELLVSGDGRDLAACGDAVIGASG